MGRKVSVGLEADVAGFVRPVETAKKAVDDLGDKVDDLDRSLNKIPVDAAKAGAALKLLDGDAQAVGKTVNNLGEKNTGLAVLDAKIREAQKEVRKLADEFQRTGDIDVFRKLGDASGRLDSLKAVRKKLADAIVITPEEAKGVFKHFAGIASQVGSETGKIFSGGFTGVLSTPGLGPILAVALIAAIGSAITIALSAAGGLLLAAGALGGVGLGIAGAIMGDVHPVAEAWGVEIEKIKAEWLGASVAFRGPLIEGAHEFGAAISSIHLDQILAKSATYLPPLITGAAGLARYLGQGLGTLVDNAGPVIAVLSAELPKIGYALQQAFAAIGSGSEGGATALRDLLQIVEAVIINLGYTVAGAEKLYGALAKFRDVWFPRDWFFIPDAEPKLLTAARAIDQTGTAAKTATVDYKAFATALNETAATADTAIGSITDKVLDMMLGLDRATLGFEESLTRLTESVKQNGNAFDIHTAKGQANREAILSAVEANKRTYDQMIATGSTIEAATAQYDTNTAAIRKTAQQAHLTKDEVGQLIDKYGKVPGDVNTEVGAKGLSAVLSNLNETLRVLAKLDGARADMYTYEHRVTLYGQGGADMGLGHQGEHKAAGGPVKAGVPYVVGDGGRPEVFVPETNGTIVPSIGQFMQSGQFASMRSSGNSTTWAGGGGDSRGSIPITLTILGGNSGLAQLLQGMQRKGDLVLTAG